MLDEHAHAVPYIVPERFEQAEAVLLPDVAEDVGDVAQLDVSGAARLLRRHTSLDIFFCLCLQVGFEFAGGLFAAGAALKETAPTHGLLPAGFRTRLTARTSCSQRLVCRRSCFRPAAVSL